MESDLRVWRKSKLARNVVGSFDSEQPKSVYRYLPLVQLLGVLETGSLPLVNPQAWPDKCEAGWIDNLFGADTQLDGMKVRATCFTRESYSEALWHVYARMQPVVRIRLNFIGLVEACAAYKKTKGKFYIGDVRYRESTQMKAAFREASSDPFMGPNEAASLLLIKRKAFSYEREMRVVFTTSDQVDDVVALPLKAKDLVKQVLVSPYTDDWVLETIKGVIKSRYAFVDCEVARSSLDRAPAWMKRAASQVDGGQEAVGSF